MKRKTQIQINLLNVKMCKQFHIHLPPDFWFLYMYYLQSSPVENQIKIIMMISCWFASECHFSLSLLLSVMNFPKNFSPDEQLPHSEQFIAAFFVFQSYHSFDSWNWTISWSLKYWKPLRRLILPKIRISFLRRLLLILVGGNVSADKSLSYSAIIMGHILWRTKIIESNFIDWNHWLMLQLCNWCKHKMCAQMIFIFATLFFIEKTKYFNFISHSD